MCDRHFTLTETWFLLSHCRIDCIYSLKWDQRIIFMEFKFENILTKNTKWISNFLTHVSNHIFSCNVWNLQQIYAQCKITVVAVSSIPIQWALIKWSHKQFLHRMNTIKFCDSLDLFLCPFFFAEQNSFFLLIERSLDFIDGKKKWSNFSERRYIIWYINTNKYIQCPCAMRLHDVRISSSACDRIFKWIVVQKL